jgi:hypothetical protein
MQFCHSLIENTVLKRITSPDGNGILLYQVFLTRYKRYSVQLEIAPEIINRMLNFTNVNF